MWMGKITLLLLLLLINPLEDSLIPSLKNKTFQAKVIGISDGDTMEVLYQNNPIKIRLAHIDCPEKRAKQPFGNNAKKALSDLCFGQMVTVKADKYDRYKRLIAVVINHKKQVVNQEMIKQGFAWHYKKYSSDSLYANLEATAKRNKIGLWSDPNPTAPWDWRKNKTKIIKIYTINSVSR